MRDPRRLFSLARTESSQSLSSLPANPLLLIKVMQLIFSVFLYGYIFTPAFCYLISSRLIWGASIRLPAIDRRAPRGCVSWSGRRLSGDADERFVDAGNTESLSLERGVSALSSFGLVGICFAKRRLLRFVVVMGSIESAQLACDE